jgi:DNA-binding NarL/FixJ family response regulator
MSQPNSASADGLSARIRLGVVDDHPVVREGLVAMLHTQPDFEIVGEAGTGPEAVELVTAHDPDVLLLDLELPGLDGVGVLRRLAETGARTRTIVFTVFDTDERIIAAVEAGAAGYLLKGVPRAEIFNAIRVVKAGGSLLHPVAATTVLRHVARKGSGNESKPMALTPRERGVLELLAQGSSNKDIARRLGMTERTVKFHVSSILTKLRAANRTEAVLHAIQAGLVSP